MLRRLLSASVLNFEDTAALPSELDEFSRRMAETLSSVARQVPAEQRGQCLIWCLNLGHPSTRAYARSLASRLGILPPGRTDGAQWTIALDANACLGIGPTDKLPYSARSQHPHLFSVPLAPGSVRAWIFAGETAGFYHVPSVTGSLLNIGGWAPVPARA